MFKPVVIVLVFLSAACLFAQQGDSLFWAADQSLMVMPTAYTMPKGMSSITDFEVLLLQYSHAITNRIHLSGGMVFPITDDMLKTFTFGSKVNYYKGSKVQTALWLSYTPDPNTATVGNIISAGNTKSSLHLLTAELLAMDDGDSQFLLGLGGITRFSSRISGIGEFYYFPSSLTIDEEDEDELNKGIMFGIRFKGQRMSWDLGGFRPIGIDVGSLIALPFVKATFLF